MENLIIIGSGPAAYSSAMFTITQRPLMFEGEIVGDIGPGGQLTTTTDVDNYPGFPHGVQGPDLMENMKKQAIEKGLRIVSRTVKKVEKEADHFSVHTSNDVYRTKSIIVATGASAKRLYAPGCRENEFWQKGISACAVCDGFFFKDEVVAIIGGGDSAMEETIYMSNIAKKVYLIHRRNEFRARYDKLEKVKSLKNVEIITPANLISAHGQEFLEFIKLENVESGEVFDLEVNGLFFAIGHIPNSKFLNNLVETNEVGYIVTNDRMHTSLEGLYACGDVQDFTYKQAVTAAASGCIAGLECIKYLEKK
ncbi:hypothetical protein GINT2_000402 [Glugoides intestinalis]